MKNSIGTFEARFVNGCHEVVEVNPAWAEFPHSERSVFQALDQRQAEVVSAALNGWSDAMWQDGAQERAARKCVVGKGQARRAMARSGQVRRGGARLVLVSHG